MSGKRVAVLSAALLPQIFGESLEVRKSQREGARYPLYLSTKVGPVHLNTPTGQDFLLENAVFDGPNGPEPIPAPIPEKPEQIPAPAPEKPLAETPKPARKGFFSDDEGLGI